MKRPERVINSTKAAFSAMFAVTDMSITLLPFVAYNSEAIWNTWTEGGAPGTRYNRTRSGWFDEVTFRDSFFSMVVPWDKSREDRTVVIGIICPVTFLLMFYKKCRECALAKNLCKWRTTAGRQKKSPEGSIS